MTNRTAIITGGLTGMGLASAIALSKAGYKIALGRLALTDIGVKSLVPLLLEHPATECIIAIGPASAVR